MLTLQAIQPLRQWLFTFAADRPAPAEPAADADAPPCEPAAAEPAAEPAAAPADDDSEPAGCGWFDSSHALQHGLTVREHASADTLGEELPLASWLVLHLAGWRAALPSVSS